MPIADPAEQLLRIAMSDGVELAATIFLPQAALNGEPQPCLLEALPYRKDDLTSSYSDHYRTLRDQHGYAVCRVDLRGTGSSGGDATDEYPAVEVTDLCAVIEWLAAQDWCDGNVGMFGTSYSGFNSLQIAAERPPALKAICAIYSSDDRWSDDVHWRGHALKLLDLVDYCHYMTPMTLLPPVPAVWGATWREEWRRRLEVNEPWVLTWLREHRDGPYWRAGSLRRRETDGWSGYERIDCAVLIVAGWADGYRNNSFRTVEALRAAGTPHRLLAGPWAHADPATAIPGPRIDLDQEMVRWWDRWLRPETPSEVEHVDTLDLFVRTSVRPEPDLEDHPGYWVSLEHADVKDGAEMALSSNHSNICMSERTQSYVLAGPQALEVEPDVGTAAWIDCAGHLPWGLSGDQREDDARSLTWDFDAPEAPVVGHPRVRLRLSASAPSASLSLKLCDVFADGTSALIARGSVDLAFCNGPTAQPLVPGEEYDVSLDLDACAYRLDPGQRLRLSVAGADWPNTIAPPAPVTLTVHEGVLELPLWDGSVGAPDFAPGVDSSGEEAGETLWSINRDVLRRTTSCLVRHGSTYEVPFDGEATESYAGEVSVDRRTFAQRADADCTFRLRWPGIDVRVTSTMRVDVTAEGYDVTITTDAFDDEELLAHRDWSEHVPR